MITENTKKTLNKFSLINLIKVIEKALLKRIIFLSLQ